MEIRFSGVAHTLVQRADREMYKPARYGVRGQSCRDACFDDEVWMCMPLRSEYQAMVSPDWKVVYEDVLDIGVEYVDQLEGAV